MRKLIYRFLIDKLFLIAKSHEITRSCGSGRMLCCFDVFVGTFYFFVAAFQLASYNYLVNLLPSVNTLGVKFYINFF